MNEKLEQRKLARQVKHLQRNIEQVILESDTNSTNQGTKMLPKLNTVAYI
jgi:hypothetical protein